MSARTVEDEDYQLRYERVAGIDVAKAYGDGVPAASAGAGEGAPDLPDVGGDGGGAGDRGAGGGADGRWRGEGVAGIDVGLRAT